MTTKTTQSIIIREWEISIAFASWLAREKGYEEITANLPKNPKVDWDEVDRRLRILRWKKNKSNKIYCRNSCNLHLTQKDGKGDVIASAAGKTKLIAECKGWTAKNNDGTRNRFSECIGQAVLTKEPCAEPWAVFAKTKWFYKECHIVFPRIIFAKAGIHLALVDADNNVEEVGYQESKNKAS